MPSRVLSRLYFCPKLAPTRGYFFVFGKDKPKDEKEKQWFEHVKQEARRIGDKVIEIHFNKTEYEFHNRWKAK